MNTTLDIDLASQVDEALRQALSSAGLDPGIVAKTAVPGSGDTTLATLKARAAEALYVDEAIYKEILGTSLLQPLPPFEWFVREAGATPASSGTGLYRSPPATGSPALSLEQRDQLADEWLRRAQADPALRVFALPHLIANRQQQGNDVSLLVQALNPGHRPFAATLLRDLIDEALRPAALDLDRAAFVLSLCEAVRPRCSFDQSLDAAVIAARTRVSSRRLFAQDHYKSARYLPRPRLHKHIGSFLAGPDAFWLLPIFAGGGMGKTIFLRHLATREWLPAGSLVARVDFDTVGYQYLAQQPWLLLLPLAEQLATQLGNLDFNSNGPLGYFAEHSESWKLLLQPGQIAGPDLRPDPPVGVEALGAGLSSEAQHFADAFGQALPRDRPVVVVLDTTEEPYLHGGQPFAALLGLFALVQKMRPGLRLILAGRYNLFGKRADDRRERVPGLRAAFEDSLAPVLEINGFTRAETGALLHETYGLQPGRSVIDAIFAKCHADLGTGRDRTVVSPGDGSKPTALPFDLALWAQMVRDDPGLTATAIRSKPGTGLTYLLQRVILRIPADPPILSWVVCYAVIPRRLTQSFLKHVLLPEIEACLVRAAAPPSGPGLPDDAIYRTLSARAAPWPMAETVSLPTLLWENLQRYTSSPEEGWIETAIANGVPQLRLHERVVIPMRELLEKWPSWAGLQARAQAWYELKAQAYPPGSDAWCQVLQNALFHAFHSGPGTGVALWRQLCQTLASPAIERPWAALDSLAEVVLGEAGFTADSENPSPLFNAAKQRRVPRDMEGEAARIRLIAALWHLGLEAHSSIRRTLAQAVARPAERWQRLTTKATDDPGLTLLTAAAHALTRGFPASSALLKRLAAGVPGIAGEPLHQLIRARVLEQAGQPAEALLCYQHAASDTATRVIHALALSRLSDQPVQALQDLEALLAAPGLEPVDALALSKELAALRLRMVQPRGAVAVLQQFRQTHTGDGVDTCSTVSLEAEALLESGLVQQAWELIKGSAAELKAAVSRNDSPGFEALRNRARRLLVLGRVAAALQNFRLAADAFELSRSDFKRIRFVDEAERAGVLQLQLKLLDIGQRFGDADGNLLPSLGARGTKTTSYKLPSAISCRNAIAASAALHSLGEYFSRIWDPLDALTLIVKTAPPLNKAQAVAALITRNRSTIADLILLLADIQPPSARLAPLAELRLASTGKGGGLPHTCAELFSSAFSDEEVSFNPPGKTSGRGAPSSPARLWLADLHRVCGSLPEARDLIEGVASTAITTLNAWLWREATLAADRLGYYLDLPAAGPAAFFSSLDAPPELDFTLRAEHLLRCRPPGSTSQRKDLQAQLASLLDHPARDSFKRTALEARLAEAAAEISLFDKAASGTAGFGLASTLWRDLGQRSQAERAAQKAREPVSDTSKRLKTKSTGEVKSGPKRRLRGHTTVSSAEDLRKATSFDESSSISLTLPDNAIIDLAATPESKTASPLYRYQGARRAYVIPEAARAAVPTASPDALSRTILERWAKDPAFAGQLRFYLSGCAEAVQAGAHAIALTTSLAALHTVPWEIALDPTTEQALIFYRTHRDDWPPRAAIVWLQAALNRLHARLGLMPAALQVDGIAGPRTLDELMEALAHVTPAPSVPPSTLGDAIRLIRELAAIAPPANQGDTLSGGPCVAYLDGTPLGIPLVSIAPYFRSGIALLDIPIPSLETFESALLTTPVPLIHIRAPLESGNDDSELRLKILDWCTSAQFLRALNSMDYTLWGAPVIILDIPAPPSDYEAKRALIRANQYAAELYASLTLAVVLVVVEPAAIANLVAVSQLQIIADHAARQASVGELAHALRASSTPEAPCYVTLFAAHPELPVFPAPISPDLPST